MNIDPDAFRAGMFHNPCDENKSPDAPRRFSSVLMWSAASIVSVTAVTLIAAQLPGRVRLLGLFAIACGLISGWILSIWRGMFVPNSGRLVLLATVLLLAAGQTGMLWESHRRFVAENRTAWENAQRESNTPIHILPEEWVAQREERFREQTDWSAYLAHRTSALGDWNAPWPLLFWISEALLATAAGTLLFVKLNRSKSVSTGNQ